jgi:hypothetical protein
MEKKKINIIIIVFFALAIVGILTTSGDNTKNQAQASDNSPDTFDKQIKNEITDKHLITKNTTVTYNSVNQALLIDQSQDVYWDANSLKTQIVMDTASILEVAAKHPKEIKYVVIEYKATLLDQNRNEVMERVYLGKYFTEKTNPINWANTYGDDQERLLKANADTFWLHPTFSK